MTLCICRIHLKHSLEILNRFRTVKVQVIAQQIGPSTVHLHFNTCLGNHLSQFVLTMLLWVLDFRNISEKSKKFLTQAYIFFTQNL